MKRNLSKSSPQCDSLLKNKYEMLHNIHPATLFVRYASLANGIRYQMIKLWVPQAMHTIGEGNNCLETNCNS